MQSAYSTELADWFQYFGNITHNSEALDAFAEVVKVTNHTELWDDELAWYSSSATHRVFIFVKLRSTLFDRVASSKSSEIPWSTYLMSCDQLHNRLSPNRGFWLLLLLIIRSYSLIIISRIHLRYMFVFAAFKSLTKWTNAKKKTCLMTYQTSWVM